MLKLFLPWHCYPLATGYWLLSVASQRDLFQSSSTPVYACLSSLSPIYNLVVAKRKACSATVLARARGLAFVHGNLARAFIYNVPCNILSNHGPAQPDGRSKPGLVPLQEVCDKRYCKQPLNKFETDSHTPTYEDPQAPLHPDRPIATFHRCASPILPPWSNMLHHRACPLLLLFVSAVLLCAPHGSSAGQQPGQWHTGRATRYGSPGAANDQAARHCVVRTPFAPQPVSASSNAPTCRPASGSLSSPCWQAIHGTSTTATAATATWTPTRRQVGDTGNLREARQQLQGKAVSVVLFQLASSPAAVFGSKAACGCKAAMAHAKVPARTGRQVSLPPSLVLATHTGGQCRFPLTPIPCERRLGRGCHCRLSG